MLLRQAAVVAPLTKLDAVHGAPTRVAVASHAHAVRLARSAACTAVGLGTEPRRTLGSFTSPRHRAAIGPGEGSLRCIVIEANPDAIVSVVVEVMHNPIKLRGGVDGDESTATCGAVVTSVEPAHVQIRW